MPGIRRPQEPGDFIGRERELVRSQSLLRSARLVTFVGPGGAGKTRLAREVAARTAQGEVRCIELDSLSQAEHLPQFVAAVMGIGEPTARHPLDTLAGAIGERRLLMVLDGCEHLIEGAARLAEALLRRCAGLRVLATSREALRVPGEMVLGVGPLSLPGPDPSPSPRPSAAALGSEAVTLFVTRARACDPGFSLTGDNTAMVIDICRRLDGLPLAIELAARRMGSLGPAEILAELDDQLTLLSDDDHAGPRRHRGLRAAVEWSHRLLTPTEQAVFRRLSVLFGDFGLDQAAAVCGMDPDALRPVLSDLAAKSLIVALPAGGQHTRFRLLNTMRAYGCERLAASGEFASTRDRALATLTALAESLPQAFVMTEDMDGRLRAEGDNLIAAVEHTAVRGGDRHVLLVLALARYWRAVQQGSAARALLSQILASEPGSKYRGRALAQAAAICAVQGEPAEAMRLARAAVSMERRTGEALRLADALSALGLAQMACGDIESSITTTGECAGIFRELGQEVDAARIEGNLAWVLLSAGRVAEAGQTMANCLPALRALAPPSVLCAALHTAAVIHMAEGDIDAAEVVFAEGLAAWPGETENAPCQLDGLAVVAAERGDARRALCLSAAAAAMRARLGVQADADPGWRQKVATAMAAACRQLGPVKAEAARSAGQRLHGESLLTYVARDGPLADPWLPLTARERRVAALVARGLTNTDIAGELHLSGRTVAAHVDSIRVKLGFHTKTQVAVWAATRHERAVERTGPPRT